MLRKWDVWINVFGHRQQRGGTRIRQGIVADVALDTAVDGVGRVGEIEFRCTRTALSLLYYLQHRFVAWWTGR